MKHSAINNSPFVSIITPSYNCDRFIARTIESVLSQTYNHWEMVIVDDNSSDDSFQIIETYAKKDSRIKPIRLLRNVGASQARNKALQEASGDYIAFLDSDDIWMPSKLEKQIICMQQENSLMSYTAYETIDINNDILSFHPVKKRVFYTDLLKKPSMVGTLTLLYDAKKLGKIYFKEIGHEDYVVKLDILKKIPYAVGINELLAQYRISKNSLSGNKIKAATWVWNIYRNVENISLLKSIYYFSAYVYYSFTKYKKIK